MRNKTESGRSVVETLGVLVVMGLLMYSALKIYDRTKDKVKAEAVAKQIKTIAMDHQINRFRHSSTLNRQMVKGPYNINLTLEDGTSGNAASYFWITVPGSGTSFCESLKNSDIIQADFATINGELEGACPGEIAFYFQKNTTDTPNAMIYRDEEGQAHFCPEHAVCGGEGFECPDGYYKHEGSCQHCSPHVATCEDENTPTSCEEGYGVFGKSCISTSCTVDSDCASVCASCDNGTCTNECEIPEPDINAEEGKECGKNDCVVYDNATQSCQYKCTRLEYLESTGKQYIDTDIIGNKYSTIENSVYLTGHRNNACAAGSWGENISTERAWLSYFFGGDFRIGWGNKNASNGIEVLNETWYTWKTEIVDNKQIQYINGEKVYTSGSTADFTTNQNIYLFGMNNRGTFNYEFYGRMGYVKLYDNGSLVRDFIPVLSPNGEPCMFDRVTQKLFRNAGTGTFDYGPK